MSAQDNAISHLAPTSAGLRRRVVKGLLRTTMKPFLAAHPPVSLQRAWTKAFTQSIRKPRAVQHHSRQFGAVPVHILQPANGVPGEVVLFLHGGAYVLGGDGAYVGYAGQMAKALGRTIWLPEYRLAPEHAYPAAVEDALTAFDAIVDNGIAPERIILMGDSAGGGLSLATALALRDRGGPQAGALVLMSPWTDLTMSGESVQRLARRDPFIPPTWGGHARIGYAGARPFDDPGLSPLFAELNGLPRTLVQVGSEEILLSDSIRLVEAATQADVEIHCEVYDGLWHDFQMQVGLLPDATRAVARIRRFINGDDSH